jgi:MoaA/NifB/PqqE/SkfB family radical SAM enzyme
MCELQCRFCLYSSVEKLKGGWGLEQFKIAADKLIEIGVGRFDMTPTLGEITLDPTWKEKLSYIDGRVDYIQFYTHGMNLTEADLKFVLSLKSPFTMYFSIYGENVETFKATTGSSQYDRFLKNFLMVKNHIPFPENKRIGVDIRFRPVKLSLHVSNIDISNPFWREVLLLQSKEKNFPVLNKFNNNNWGGPLEDQTFAKKMPVLKGACDCLNLTINPNGDAVICDICHPYDERFEILGNIFKDDAADIFKNLHKVWKLMEQGVYPEICKNCTEFTCSGEREDVYDAGWKSQHKVFWEDSFLEKISKEK